MDPLFGFNGFSDDIMEHQGQGQSTAGGDQQAVGEYTISFPVDQSQNYSSQLQGNSQFGGATAQQSNQVVHVVSGGSSDDKQVYVIKLENILQEGGNGNSNVNLDGSAIKMEEQMDTGQGINIKQEPEEEMEGGFYSSGEDESSSSSSSSSEEEEEKKREGNGDDDEDDENGPDPFVAVSPESVMAMASSVGVDLSEEVASELGCIVTNKLRFLVLMAMQFSQHENTMGMMVEHFAKAEEQIGSPGFGHKSVFRDTAFKYAGGVSILDDGPEMDLYESIRQTETIDIPIDVVDPVLNVHHLKKFESKRKVDNIDSEVYNEPVVDCICENEDDEEEETETGTEKPAMEGANSAGANVVGTNETLESNDDHVEDSEDDELDINEIVEEIVKENHKESQSDPTNAQKEKSEAGEAPCETDGEDEDDDEMAPEWAVYLQMLLELIVSHDYKRDFKRFSKTNFQRILDDVRRNGISPIFHIVCDGFRDYLRNPELSQSSIMNILSMLDALVSSRCSPSHDQLNDVGSTLIEIIILPPPCEVHPFLTRVFMKVLKNCNELLTWTCTYVTEMLKGISETPLDQLVESFKSTMHGALCLANGLEEQSIRVAQEFGWHTSLLNFVKSHCTVFDGQAYSPTTQDSYLEEEILKFYHNFLKNYVSLIPPHEMTAVREAVESVYGERYLAFVAEPSHIVTSKKTSAPGKNIVSKKTRAVFKKVVYKNREIIVPYRRRVK